VTRPAATRAALPDGAETGPFRPGFWRSGVFIAERRPGGEHIADDSFCRNAGQRPQRPGPGDAHAPAFSQRTWAHGCVLKIRRGLLELILQRESDSESAQLAVSGPCHLPGNFRELMLHNRWRRVAAGLDRKINETNASKLAAQVASRVSRATWALALAIVGIRVFEPLPKSCRG